MVKVLEKPKKKKNFFLRLAFVIVLIYVLATWVNQQITIAEKKQEKQLLEAQLSEQNAENAELKLLSEEENVKALMEKIARETLDYVFPGEKEYIRVY